MTLQALRVFLQSWFCGCGSPEAAAARLRDILALHPLYEHRNEFKRLIPDEGLQDLLLYTLDHFELTEHGGNVNSAWLTGLGQEVLAALTLYGVEAATVASCVHGYDLDEPCPDCATTP